jgi:hypothetical protein
MNGKSFLAAGDVVINPSQIAYASIETNTEGIQLRLGFAGLSGAPGAELVLEGIEARSVLRWLRHNAEFLDSGPAPVSLGRSRDRAVIRA